MTERCPAPLTARELMREPEVLIPLGMSVGAAASLLEAVGCGAAPVVDSRGRCVGVFTAADYRRWLDHDGAVVGSVFTDAVRHHISGRFTAAASDAGVRELLNLLKTGGDQFLVVLDWQGRPRGIVCALDVLVAESEPECNRVEGELVAAN